MHAHTHARMYACTHTHTHTHLCEIFVTRDATVQDLVEALRPMKEDVDLIQNMTIGQRNNPLWMDARQWRVTSSNFGKVCNRNFKQMYPPSLLKAILRDYGTFHTAALQWGCDHESEAIQLCTTYTGIHVKEYGVFLSEEYPYLATSPMELFTSQMKSSVLLKLSVLTSSVITPL